MSKSLRHLAYDASLVKSNGPKDATSLLRLAALLEELAVIVDDKLSELDARLVEVEPARIVEGEFAAAAMHARGIKAVACPEFQKMREAAIQQVDGVVNEIKKGFVERLEELATIRSKMAAAQTGVDVADAVHLIYDPEFRLKLSPESVAVMDLAAKLLCDGVKVATQNIRL